ncbi:MAG TPA: DNA-formamidopyrimidine glycosylase family protein, partial [Planctomycetia bacterium]|nr:DNA-formamidopyrimidine glycosylase family protein [Planctomycetia bacterium]
MPELPDITLYVEALEDRARAATLERIRIANPFLLRSVDPSPEACEGKKVRAIRRLGKRIVFALEDELFVVLHLMIPGRLQWKPKGTKPPARVGLAALDFTTGAAILTEQGSKRRASLFIV